MNRYDHHFRSLPAAIRVNAAQKVGFARGALIQHRGNGFGPEDDDAIVRQFDLSGMAEFWDVVLSEPMECDDFAHALAVHFMVIEHKPGGTDKDRLASGPAAIQAAGVVKAQLRSALRRARVDGEPWFIEIPEPPPSTKLDAKAWLGFVPSDTYIEPPAPPPDGVDLSRLKVRPRAAVDWLIAMPMRKHLVPPSLVRTVGDADVAQAPERRSVDNSQTAASAESSLTDEGLRQSEQRPAPKLAVPYLTGAPGRPTSMQTIIHEWNARIARGENLPLKKDEAGALRNWLATTHPDFPLPSEKAIKNRLSKKL